MDATSPVSQIKVQIDALLDLLAQQEEDLRNAQKKLHRANTEVMLYGKAPPPDGTADLGGLFESDLFVVVALELPDRSQLFLPDGAARFSQEEVDFMKSAIYNVCETALGPYSIATCCESDMAFANILINLPDEDVPYEQMLTSIDAALDSALELVQRNYSITLIAARSSLVQGHENLPGARLAAYQALQQRYTIDRIPNTGVVPPPTTEGLTAYPQPNPKLEKQYYQCILSRDLETAKLILKELTEQDLQSDQVPFALAKLRFMNHMESLLNLLGVASTELSYLYLRPLDTEEAIRQLLEDLFRDMEERTSASDQALRSKIEAVARYIQENYQDCNLCLAKLCDVFQMNQSYLSRTFKNIFGIGILDFIHKQRLIHVKQQLQEPDSNIDTIWHSVGYTNRRTFNRTFRRLEGMSASEYRKKLLLPEA